MSAFGGPGPHIPPPREDDSPVSQPSPPPEFVDAATEQEGVQGSKVGSLKRVAVKTRGSGSGSLRGRQGAENKENEAYRGVQLEDRAMDDFS
jgi:hypothetical protein